MEKKIVSPLLGQMLQKIAPKIGAKVLMEPAWGIVGQITFKNGRRVYFRYSSLDLNPLGASEIAKDKDYARFFMEAMGYSIVPGQTFFASEWARAVKSRRNIDAAYRYAQQIGLPVFVKPNSGSQGGGVALVHTKAEFYRALRHIFKRDRVALVQKPVSGKDYRVVVLDGQIISAYERIPLHVVGNGRATIAQLLRAKQEQFVASSRDTNLKLEDPRLREKLKRQKLSFRSVPARGQRVYLLDNANLSTGGTSIDVTEQVHPDFRSLCVRLTKDMGLRFAGVDLIVESDISQPPQTYWVLEINAAPGLDHYVKTGRKQEKIVEQLYLEVLKSLEKMPG